MFGDRLRRCGPCLHTTQLPGFALVSKQKTTQHTTTHTTPHRGARLLHKDPTKVLRGPDARGRQAAATRGTSAALTAELLASRGHTLCPRDSSAARSPLASVNSPPSSKPSRLTPCHSPSKTQNLPNTPSPRLSGLSRLLPKPRLFPAPRLSSPQPARRLPHRGRARAGGEPRAVPTRHTPQHCSSLAQSTPGRPGPATAATCGGRLSGPSTLVPSNRTTRRSSQILIFWSPGPLSTAPATSHKARVFHVPNPRVLHTKRQTHLSSQFSTSFPRDPQAPQTEDLTGPAPRTIPSRRQDAPESAPVPASLSAPVTDSAKSRGAVTSRTTLSAFRPLSPHPLAAVHPLCRRSVTGASLLGRDRHGGFRWELLVPACPTAASRRRPGPAHSSPGRLRLGLGRPYGFSRPETSSSQSCPRFPLRSPAENKLRGVARTPRCPPLRAVTAAFGSARPSLPHHQVLFRAFPAGRTGRARATRRRAARSVGPRTSTCRRARDAPDRLLNRRFLSSNDGCFSRTSAADAVICEPSIRSLRPVFCQKIPKVSL